jgi:hypothetical protein
LWQVVLEALVDHPQLTKLVEAELVVCFNPHHMKLPMDLTVWKLDQEAMVVHLDLTVVMEQ